MMGGIILIIQIKEGGLAYSTQTSIPGDSDITLNSLRHYYFAYEKFYSHMTKGTFIGMTRATPEKFQFSIKVPETVTHVKRLDIKKGAMLLAIS